MPIFKTKWFARFARKEGISDAALTEAISQAEKGLVDAKLGGDLIKQRVARSGGGKSGGYRTLIAFRAKDRAVFLYGFAKNERENIKDDELATLKEIAAAWMAADTKKIERALKEGELHDVNPKEPKDEKDRKK
ncbi:MAG: type II toxin-antitoxin system RelE/ParE family toxin [Alphaproteobacteria bacterium]|nr:type II toxin-antitoxin system RelE/ParE family toxin [Alphaproteobacteria bacterium]